MLSFHVQVCQFLFPYINTFQFLYMLDLFYNLYLTCHPCGLYNPFHSQILNPEFHVSNIDLEGLLKIYDISEFPWPIDLEHYLVVINLVSFRKPLTKLGVENSWTYLLNQAVVSSVVPRSVASTSPENLLEIQIIRPHLRSIEPKTLRAGYSNLF